MAFVRKSRIDSQCNNLFLKLTFFVDHHKRTVLVLLIATGISLYFLFENLGPKYCPAADCLDTAVYFKDRILQSLRIAYKDDELPIWNGTVGDKVIIMAHTNSEDVSWVEHYLPE